MPAFLFSNEVKKTNIAQNSFHICNNKFLSFVSQFFNNIYHDPNVSPVSASFFYSVAPKSPKLQRQEILHSLNPYNTLEGVFNRLGGILCLYKGYGNYNYKGETIVAFVWFHSNFQNLVDLSETIELDCSFKLLSPDVFCVPQMIYRNTGFPLALIVGPKESCDFYSLFFESMKKIDQRGKLLDIFLKKN